MPLPKTSKVFKSLSNNIHHSEKITIQKNIFDTNSTINEHYGDYWKFSDLYNLFGPDIMGNPKLINETVKKIITNDVFISLPTQNKDKILRPNTFDEFYNNHIKLIYSDYSIKQKNKNEITDAKLSRFTCWKILKQYPNLIFSQLYFMHPNISEQELQKLATSFSRVYLRHYVSKAERILCGIAYKNNIDLCKFNHAITQLFFYNNDTDTLKSIHNIRLRDKDPIANYMGCYSLSAFNTGLSKSIQYFNATNQQMPIDKFLDQLLHELYYQRTNMYKKRGIYPEQDIKPISEQQIHAELKTKEKEFINKYAFEKIR